MNIDQFILENASPVIGLIGAIIGSLFTAIPFMVFQILQRKWQIEDERKQWRRGRLLNRLSIVQDWLDAVLRFSQAFEIWYRQDEDRMPADFLNTADGDLKPHFDKLSEIESIMDSHAISTGDDELLSLIKSFKSTRINLVESLSSNNAKRVEVYRAMLDALASKIARRIEYLVEEASPVGGPYHKKSILRILQRKLRSKDQNATKPA